MGPLPPSSSTWALPAARTATLEPVSTDPTKPSPATAAFPTSASPTGGAGAVTRVSGGGGGGHPHEGVPGGQGRREHLGPHRLRPAPRADHADHPERHPLDQDPA